MKTGLRLYAFTDGTVIIRDGDGYTRYPKGSRIGFGEGSILTVVLVSDSYERWCIANELDASVITDYHTPGPPIHSRFPQTIPVKSTDPPLCSYCKNKGLVVLGGALEPCPVCHGECIKDVVVKDGGKR